MQFEIQFFVFVYVLYFLQFFVLFGITEKVVTVFASVRFEFEKKKFVAVFFFFLFSERTERPHICCSLFVYVSVFSTAVVSIRIQNLKTNLDSNIYIAYCSSVLKYLFAVLISNIVTV